MKYYITKNGILRIYDESDNFIFGEKTNRQWVKKEWSYCGRLIYQENSYGIKYQNKII